MMGKAWSSQGVWAGQKDHPALQLLVNPLLP